MSKWKILYICGENVNWDDVKRGKEETVVVFSLTIICGSLKPHERVRLRSLPVVDGV